MFDLVRLSYVAKHRREAMDLNMRQLEKITGVSKSQISALEHGQRVAAGSTFLVMEALGIDPADMLTPDAQVRLERIRAVHAADRQNASHETASETNPSQERAA
ncbi:MAG: helix-turn-helix transcriptional regulator [Nitratireductor sp.]|nr:helix-turn-helix transcriptional regulator [Nitratireductor sp.]